MSEVPFSPSVHFCWWPRFQQVLLLLLPEAAKSCNQNHLSTLTVNEADELVAPELP